MNHFVADDIPHVRRLLQERRPDLVRLFDENTEAVHDAMEDVAEEFHAPEAVEPPALPQTIAGTEPMPKFNLEDPVWRPIGVDGSKQEHGVVEGRGEFDDFLGTFRYRVREASSGRIFYWNEPGMRREPRGTCDLAPPPVVEAYSYGKCIWLALALHEERGWPIYAQFDQIDGQDHIAHAYVKLPDGREADVMGVQDHVDVFSPGATVRVVSAAEIKSYAKSPQELTRELENARAVAREYVLPGIDERCSPHGVARRQAQVQHRGQPQERPQKPQEIPSPFPVLTPLATPPRGGKARTRPMPLAALYGASPTVRAAEVARAAVEEPWDDNERPLVFALASSGGKFQAADAKSLAALAADYQKGKRTVLVRVIDAPMPVAATPQGAALGPRERNLLRWVDNGNTPGPDAWAPGPMRSPSLVDRLATAGLLRKVGIQRVEITDAGRTAISSVGGEP